VFFKGASGVLVLGLCLWICKPQLVGDAICLFLGPFHGSTSLINWVVFPQPLESSERQVMLHVCELFAQVVHPIVGERACGSSVVQDPEHIIALSCSQLSLEDTLDDRIFDWTPWQWPNPYGALAVFRLVDGDMWCVDNICVVAGRVTEVAVVRLWPRPWFTEGV